MARARRLATDDANGSTASTTTASVAGACAPTTLVVDRTACSLGQRRPNSGDFIVEAFIVDNCGGPAAGATVDIDVDSPLGALSCQAETDSGGRIACALDNPPDGNYVSTVAAVSKTGFTWSGTSAPDPDTPCRCELFIGQGGPTCNDGLCEGDEATTCPQDCVDLDSDGVSDSHDNCPDVSNARRPTPTVTWRATPATARPRTPERGRPPGKRRACWPIRTSKPGDHDPLDGPAETGALAIAYDTIRSEDPADFGAAVCLESGGADLEATDGDAIAPDVLRSYLIRAVNACPAPAGDGPLGETSTGSPTDGTDLPLSSTGLAPPVLAALAGGPL